MIPSKHGVGKLGNPVLKGVKRLNLLKIKMCHTVFGGIKQLKSKMFYFTPYK